MLIPLNIVTSYPVRWTKYQVLRDFLQNFYDSTGYKDFHERLRYEYASDSQSLSITVRNTVFNYEWLLHIGASTKQGDESKAGFFGEGFKVATLCAIRDYGWQVLMRSGDWELDAVTTDHQIDGIRLKMLAYDVRTVDAKQESCLVISRISKTDYQLFEDVIVSFYYPQNPLLGDLLWESDTGAVYTRSDMPYNEERYEEGFKEGYREGWLIGRMESAIALVESGLIPIPLIAKVLDMNEVELRARLGIGFDNMEHDQLS